MNRLVIAGNLSDPWRCGQIMVDLAVELRQRGWNPVLVDCCLGHSSSDLKNRGGDSWSLPTNRYGKLPSDLEVHSVVFDPRNPLAGRRWRKWLIQQAIDLVHAWDPSLPLLQSIVRASIPVVATYTETAPPTLAVRRRLERRAPVLFIDGRTGETDLTLETSSGTSSSRLAASGIYSGERLHEALDADETVPVWPGPAGETTGGEPLTDRAESPEKRLSLRHQLGLPRSSRVVLTQAPLEPANSLKDLIWALDLLCCIRRDIHLVVLGTGSQRWRLERFARCTEALPNLHLIDSLELVDLRSADFYWNSISRWESTGLIQALSWQVPVVSTYLPGCELLRHQQTAMLTEPGSRDQFARWTKYLLEHPAAAEQLGVQARTWSLRCRPTHAWAAGYEGCYRQLTSQTSTRKILR